MREHEQLLARLQWLAGSIAAVTTKTHRAAWRCVRMARTQCVQGQAGMGGSLDEVLVRQRLVDGDGEGQPLLALARHLLGQQPRLPRGSARGGAGEGGAHTATGARGSKVSHACSCAAMCSHVRSHAQPGGQHRAVRLLLP